MIAEVCAMALSGSVFIVGDSIAKSISDEVSAYPASVTINAVDGRRTIRAFKPLRSPEAQRSQTWVLVLGTNDGHSTKLFSKRVSRVMKMSNDRKVLWVNTYRPPMQGRDFAAQNDVLENAPYDNLCVVDWESVARQNPQWFIDDPARLHPNTEGQQKLASLIFEGENNGR